MGGCFAPDFAIEIGVSIRQHPTGPLNPLGGSDHDRNDPWNRPCEKATEAVLDPPSQKYEIWLQLVRQEVTIAEAAADHQVDRTTIMRIRTVAKEGALAALAASKPGTAASTRLRAGSGEGGECVAVRGAQGDGRTVDAGRGKGSPNDDKVVVNRGA